MVFVYISIYEIMYYLLKLYCIKPAKFLKYIIVNKIKCTCFFVIRSHRC